MTADLAAITPAPRARRPATIYDIAREAGVSHQSVSRFMRGIDQRQRTRDKISQALLTLEYKPNLTARSLVTGRSHRIGALTHEIDQVGPSQVLQGASAAAREAGYLLDIVTLDMGNIDEIAEALEMLHQHDLAGVVALASTDQMRHAVEKITTDVPILLFSEDDDERANSSLNGMPLVMEHLASLGHCRIAHIAGPQTWSAARNRHHAYQDFLKVHRLEPPRVAFGDWSARSGYEAAKILLEGSPRPTGIAAANDQMALGAMLAASELGLGVPDDISITGLDDTPEAGFFNPPLTTARVDFRAEGRRAVNEMLRQVDADAVVDLMSERVRLVVRRSTHARPDRK